MCTCLNKTALYSCSLNEGKSGSIFVLLYSIATWRRNLPRYIKVDYRCSGRDCAILACVVDGDRCQLKHFGLFNMRIKTLELSHCYDSVRHYTAQLCVLAKGRITMCVAQTPYNENDLNHLNAAVNELPQQMQLLLF